MWRRDRLKEYWVVDREGGRKDGLKEYYVVNKEDVEKGRAEGVLGGG